MSRIPSLHSRGYAVYVPRARSLHSTFHFALSTFFPIGAGGEVGDWSDPRKSGRHNPVAAGL